MTKLENSMPCVAELNGYDSDGKTNFVIESKIKNCPKCIMTRVGEESVVIRPSGRCPLIPDLHEIEASI